MGNEENFGILKQRPQNSFMSSYIFGKNVSVIRKTSVGSNIHNGNLWISNTWVKNVLVYELSKYHAALFWKKIRCNWYSKVSFRALCEVQRCNMDSSVKIRVMDTAGRIKSTLKNIIGYN